jgi:hypothetical protein
MLPNIFLVIEFLIYGMICLLLWLLPTLLPYLSNDFTVLIFVHIYGILVFILFKVKLCYIYLFVYLIAILCTCDTAEGNVSNLLMVLLP